jgi:hypothetical protein
MNRFFRFFRSLRCTFLIYFISPRQIDGRRDLVGGGGKKTAFWRFKSGKCETNHETLAGNKTAMANGEVKSS